jgi:hypothetical protein
MTLETRTEAVRALEMATSELLTLSLATTREIESVARTFAGLAGHADAILNLAAAMVRRESWWPRTT